MSGASWSICGTEFRVSKLTCPSSGSRALIAPPSRRCHFGTGESYTSVRAESLPEKVTEILSCS
jgi:hypothetical protein